MKTLSEMSYQYDEETTETLVSDAKEADSDIVFIETYVPAIIAVIGITIILIAVMLNIRRKRREKQENQEA